MNIKRVQEIVATLPLSYYFGEKANYSLRVDENEETSFCNLYSHRIVISMKNIENAEKSMKTEATESVIRGLVYHELSHAILTNPYLINAYECYYNMTGNGRNPSYEFNVIEDERIETIFANFYLGVDFWKNRLLVLGPCTTPAETKEQYLFNVARYHETEGHPEALEALKPFLSCTCNRYSNSDKCYDTARKGYDAVSKIYEIFEKVQQERERQEQSKDGKESKQDESEQEQSKEKEEEKEEKEEDKSSIFTEQEQDKLTKEAKKVVIQEVNKDYRHFYGETLDQKKADNTLTASLLKIIARNGGFGVSDELSTEGYTGDFDPELKMQDFSGNKKWWSDSDDYGNTSKTASEKILNIWLDNSSSFYSNDKAVNQILASLAEIEKKMKSFKFRLVRITNTWDEMKGNQRISKSNGGNWIPDSVKDIYARLNMTGEEKNIVLFDGQAGYPEQFRSLKCFDNRNTTFIIEESNTEYIKKNCRNSIIIEENFDYAGTLFKNIEKAFDQLF